VFQQTNIRIAKLDDIVDESATAGRGRWANHVKKATGGRGPRPTQNGSSQDTGRPGRGGGRGRRGGGRWGNRQPKVQVLIALQRALRNQSSLISRTVLEAMSSDGI